MANVWLWSQFDDGEAHLGSTSFVQRHANNAETVLFTMSFAFVLYGHKAEEGNMTWPIAHDANPCTFWRSCTGVSHKRHFLCIMRNFGYSWLRHMQILVGRVLHTGTESTLKMSYLGCFGFSFCQGYMVNKKWHYSAGGIALQLLYKPYTTRDWVMHILDSWTFCVSFLCIMHEFRHSSIT